MNIVDDEFLEQLNKFEDGIENEKYKKLVKTLSKLNDENLDKIEILLDTLASKDKNKALDLAKESTMNFIKCIENDDLYYIVEIQMIKSYLHIINDKKLIDRYQNLDIYLAKELLIDLNDIVLE